MEIATNIKPNTCQNAIEISNSTQLQPMKAVRGPSSGLEAREEEGVKIPGRQLMVEMRFDSEYAHTNTRTFLGQHVTRVVVVSSLW